MTQTDNIDIDEVEKFSSRANQWWDPNGEFKTLHDINPARLEFIKKYTTLKNAHVLDLGCGGGILAESMANENAIVTGLDASQENINIASEHASKNQIEINYIVNTAEKLSETHSMRYDVITCMEMLEHVPNPMSIIQAAGKMIKPGGHAFFSTLNRNLKSYLQAVIAGEYLFKLLPKGTHQYEKFIRPSELCAWCMDSGLEINDIAGMQYNPISGQCNLTARPDVNYLIDTIAKGT